MNQRVAVEQLQGMYGKPVVSNEDEKIGDFEGLYYDEPTGEPRWVATSVTKLGGLMGIKYYLVPLEQVEVSPDGERLRVSYSKEIVEQSPEIDSDEISPEMEEQIYKHYNLAPSPYETNIAGDSRVTDVAGERRFTEGETVVERNEEEMRVGKRETERGRVRLHKWVETQPVEEDVNLLRETAHVEREAVDRPAPGARIGEEEVEMTLHEEEPVVDKETRTKEEIRLEREAEEHVETVRGEVRREHVDVDEEDVDRKR